MASFETRQIEGNESSRNDSPISIAEGGSRGSSSHKPMEQEDVGQMALPQQIGSQHTGQTYLQIQRSHIEINQQTISMAGGAMSPCDHCKRKHPGECWKVTGACFKCGSHEHLRKNCPKKAAISTLRTEGSIPTPQKGKKSSKGEIEGSSQRGTPETKRKSETDRNQHKRSQ